MFCCLLIGSFIGLVSGIYFRGGGGFRRSILVFFFVVFIIFDVVVVCLMHEVWSGIPFSFERTAFYTNCFHEVLHGSPAFRFSFGILSLLGSIPGIAAAFFLRDFVIGK